jgi:2-methylcitrate dehydratase PrpD
MIQSKKTRTGSRSVVSFRRSTRAFAILLALSASAANTGQPASQRAALDRSGVLATREGLTLKFTGDEGSVKIVTLERGAAPVVRYSVHVETDLRINQAQQILERYSVSARTSPSGVEIVSALPPQPPHGAQFSVHFEIAVPANYNVDVNTEVGDIETTDIGGTASLVTHGGNIRLEGLSRN